MTNSQVRVIQFEMLLAQFCPFDVSYCCFQSFLSAVCLCLLCCSTTISVCFPFCFAPWTVFSRSNPSHRHRNCRRCIRHSRCPTASYLSKWTNKWKILQLQLEFIWANKSYPVTQIEAWKLLYWPLKEYKTWKKFKKFLKLKIRKKLSCKNNNIKIVKIISAVKIHPLTHFQALKLFFGL